MKYFFDTEFIEGFREYRVDVLKKKKAHFIDLISIGIVCEDGRSYYAVSTDFNPKEADDWVKRNVLQKLPARYAKVEDRPRLRQEAMLWKDNKTIAEEVKKFILQGHSKRFNADEITDWEGHPIEMYAYYADYDWVLLCSLFGRMIDLPEGFPMYCRDLKQIMDEKGLDKNWKNTFCPEPDKEHDALEDAKWNLRLYEAIKRAESVPDL